MRSGQGAATSTARSEQDGPQVSPVAARVLRRPIRLWSLASSSSSFDPLLYLHLGLVYEQEWERFIRR